MHLSPVFPRTTMMHFLLLPLMMIIAELTNAATTSTTTAPQPLSCAEQIHRCGALAEEFETQIQETKILASRRCFLNRVWVNYLFIIPIPHFSCAQERVAFDNCFIR